MYINNESGFERKTSARSTCSESSITESSVRPSMRSVCANMGRQFQINLARSDSHSVNDNSLTASTSISGGKIRISGHINFILCGVCFWCASFFDGKSVGRCPSCESSKIESMPIVRDEMYTVGHDGNHGITIGFSSIKT
jgi:hypothetical protein